MELLLPQFITLMLFGHLMMLREMRIVEVVKMEIVLKLKFKQYGKELSDILKSGFDDLI